MLMSATYFEMHQKYKLAGWMYNGMIDGYMIKQAELNIILETR